MPTQLTFGSVSMNFENYYFNNFVYKCKIEHQKKKKKKPKFSKNFGSVKKGKTNIFFRPYIHKPCLVPYGRPTFQMRSILHFQPILQLDQRWSLTLVCEGSHVISINQVWSKSDINFSNEANFTFSAYLTTWPQMTFDLGMWPLDLTSKWIFPCCIYTV